MEIQVVVPCGMTTSKSVAWGGKRPELFKASQEAIRYAVQNSPERERLEEWLESRIRLALTVEFHLTGQRAHKCDLIHLLETF